MYTKIDTSQTEIVSFVFTKNRFDMEAEIARLGTPWIVVSDFKMDHSEAKITYDIQSTPKVLQIEKGGLIIDAKDGLGESDYAFIMK